MMGSSYECPVCGQPLMGPDETCNGSLLDRAHPLNVPAVPVEAQADKEPAVSHCSPSVDTPLDQTVAPIDYEGGTHPDDCRCGSCLDAWELPAPESGE